jgi:hypothetical protein
MLCNRETYGIVLYRKHVYCKSHVHTHLYLRNGSPPSTIGLPGSSSMTKHAITGTKSIRPSHDQATSTCSPEMRRTPLENTNRSSRTALPHEHLMARCLFASRQRLLACTSREERVAAGSWPPFHSQCTSEDGAPVRRRSLANRWTFPRGEAIAQEISFCCLAG